MSLATLPVIMWTGLTTDRKPDSLLDAYHHLFYEKDTGHLYVWLNPVWTLIGEAWTHARFRVERRMVDYDAPPADNFLLFGRLDSAGKGRLCVRFPNGDVQTLGTDPSATDMVYGQFFIGPTAISSSPARVGSIWLDTITPSLKRCSSASPYTWVSVESGGTPGAHASSHEVGGSDSIAFPRFVTTAKLQDF